MKEQNENEKKKKPKLSKEKKFYLFTAIGCAAALLAIIIVAVVITNTSSVQNTGTQNTPPASSVTPDSGENVTPPVDEKPVVTVPEGMVSPMQSLTVLNDHGFYHNSTLDCYYAHVGVDFSAAAGTQVFATEDGVVESIYKDDILLGTQIVIDHGNGLKTSYCFVTETDGLKVGASVKKGDVIATVAEPTGKEYKDGAHLHFEVFENGKSVDPALHLTLDEK